MLKYKERLLLEELQFRFPLTRQPFLEIAERMRLTEDEVVQRIRNLKKKKLIRYIGAIFDNEKLKLKSSLLAMRVPQEKLGKAVKIINGYPQVSHNYLRDDAYNLWFTLSAASENELLRIIKEIKKKTGIKDLLNLKTLKVFKIDARFKV